MEDEERYQELVKEIRENSQYKRLPSSPKTMMSVLEMGNMLGLKKTGRYWLLHKNFFESVVVEGKTLIFSA